MTFGRPEFLLFLAIPLLLVVWELTRRAPRIALPFDHGQQASGRWLGYFVTCAELLPAMLLTLAILIFSRPLRTAEPKQERQIAAFLAEQQRKRRRHEPR